MIKQYDIAIIGGGPGGYIAAIRAAQLGKKTVLVEKSEIGGTCLNRGCIPTKTLLQSSHVYKEILHSKELGIIVDKPKIKYKKMVSRKNKVVKMLRGGVESLVKENGVDLISGEAKLIGKNELIVNQEKIQASKIILATGSIPFIPPIKGANSETLLTSKDVLELKECPESVIIIGGGVIGIEFATLFSDLGKKVTIIEAMPQILNGMDVDISTSMARQLNDMGVTLHTNAKVVEIVDKNTCAFELCSRKEEISAELIICAVGRKPNTTELGLEELGVLTERGFVKTDNKMQTNIEGIYAIGDITGQMQLAHVATAQGLIAAANASNLEKEMEYNAVPACIYTNPEIACVGLTEEEAVGKGYDIKVGKFNVSGNGRSLASNCMDGFIKLISDTKTRKILGCHIFSLHATEMISECTLAMSAGLTVDHLADTIHPHPTVSEIIMEAAHDIDGTCCHKL